MPQLTDDFANSIAAGAMLLLRKDKSPVTDYPYKKLFRIIEPKDKLRSRYIRPQFDVPLPVKTLESQPAHKAKIYEPYGGEVRVYDYTTEIELSQDLSYYEQTGELKSGETHVDLLKRKLAQTRDECLDKYAAMIFVNAFSNSHLGKDGRPLCATDHPIKAGGVCANRLAVSQSLTAGSVANLASLMAATKNDQGEYKPKLPKYLVVGPSLWQKAEQICGSDKEPYTSDNQINFAKNKLKLEPIMWPYITSPTAYFLVSPKEENGLIIYMTKDIEVHAEANISNRTYKFVVVLAFDITWIDWRGVSGDPGTG